jgi:hypothetical protein
MGDDGVCWNIAVEGICRHWHGCKRVMMHRRWELMSLDYFFF